MQKNIISIYKQFSDQRVGNFTSIAQSMRNKFDLELESIW